MKQVPISQLNKGAYFRFKDSYQAPIWCKDHYDRSSRTYAVHPIDDFCRELFCKPNRMVFVEVD